MEDSNNSKVHGGSISDEKLAALYDFLTDEGFCPECIENESIIFSYYGTSVEICCSNEDNRDIYSLVYIVDANKDILMNDWDRLSKLMSEYPMIKVLRDEEYSHLYIVAFFKANINDREKFRSRLYLRLDAIFACRKELDENYDPIYPEVQRAFAMRCLKGAGYCPEIIGETGIWFTYSDVHYQLWLYQWGFNVLVSVPANEYEDDYGKLVHDIFRLLQSSCYKCTPVENNEGEKVLRFSSEIYYSSKEWENENSSYFLGMLEFAVDCIGEASYYLSRKSEVADNSEDFDPSSVPLLSDSEYNANYQFLFNSLKYYGYRPEANGNLIHVETDEIHFYIGPAANNKNLYFVVALHKLDEKADKRYMSEVAIMTMRERFGQCYIQKGNDGDELWFKTYAAFPEDMDDEKFISDFKSQVRHIHDIMVDVFDREDEYESDEDGDTEETWNENIGNQEEVMTIFKYLKDAGLCEQEPEDNAIVFNLDGAERCFVVLEYGYFIYHDIWASEEKHHTFENEAEAANDIINDTPNMIQIYRIEDGEEHGMRFSWFFDEFPADNAEEFISDIKAVAEAMDSYENEFRKKLEEIESKTK